ncbi:hypothetical protein RRG08_012372 [Elysia crispata]|uniref:Uncharacterized protein n=1 Tax=Elysia crispata TaxID=231223 RepID=A0AAE0ZRF4_9GAST|nr:hypothetical protein RRG08_012372 [Elysia crispata]
MASSPDSLFGGLFRRFLFLAQVKKAESHHRTVICFSEEMGELKVRRNRKLCNKENKRRIRANSIEGENSENITMYINVSKILNDRTMRIWVVHVSFLNLMWQPYMALYVLFELPVSNDTPP